MEMVFVLTQGEIAEDEHQAVGGLRPRVFLTAAAACQACYGVPSGRAGRSGFTTGQLDDKGRHVFSAHDKAARYLEQGAWITYFQGGQPYHLHPAPVE